MKIKENKMLGILGNIFVYDCGFKPKNFKYVQSDLLDGMYLAGYNFTQHGKKYTLVVNYEERIDELVLTIQDNKNVLFTNFTSLRKFTTRATNSVPTEIASDEEIINVCKEHGWTDFEKFIGGE